MPAAPSRRTSWYPPGISRSVLSALPAASTNAWLAAGEVHLRAAGHQTVTACGTWPAWAAGRACAAWAAWALPAQHVVQRTHAEACHSHPQAAGAHLSSAPWCTHSGSVSSAAWHRRWRMPFSAWLAVLTGSLPTAGQAQAGGSQAEQGWAWGPVRPLAPQHLPTRTAVGGTEQSIAARGLQICPARVHAEPHG